jgi:hypothetical protein
VNWMPVSTYVATGLNSNSIAESLSLGRFGLNSTAGCSVLRFSRTDVRFGFWS